MSDQNTILDMLEDTQNRRETRRRFMRMCGGATAMAGGLALLSACDDDDDNDDNNIGGTTPTPTPPAAGTGVSEIDVLNFALQLEYLEASYYNQAAFGTGVSDSLSTGTSAPGAVTGGMRVNFTDPVVAEFAREIAYDEIAHVTFLRQALGSAATARPAINIAGDASGAFTAAARAAGVIGMTDTFNPYANDENFLLGAYLLTDVGVSAYRGSAKLIINKTFLEAAAGILAAECYHDGAIRSTLYNKGLTRTDLMLAEKTVQISNARDSLDGPADLDQGIIDAMGANLVPTDGDGLVLGRTPQQVLNVVYLNRAAVTSGGFFPAGVNGNLRQSAAT